MSNIVDVASTYDPFGSQVVAIPSSVMAYKPTWGISSLRYSTTTTGTGAAATETGGEFKISSGTDTSGVSQVQTIRRGQYQPGSQARFGIGIRIPTAPASTAVMTWGYFDTNNGFLFGRDATGVYVSRRSGGSDNKAYQTSWNVDKLDGTGVSGLTLDLSKGAICQCKFTWYGYGLIEFGFVLYNSTIGIFEYVTCHRIKVDSSLSIVDPNQPLTFRVDNGASNTTSYDVYIGGHQYEYFNGTRLTHKRDVSEILTNYTTATNTNWQPLIAVRRKSTHGTSGRDNSTSVVVSGYGLCSDGEMETRLTFGGATSNLSWATPTGWTSAESACETKITTSGTALTTSSDGFPCAYNFASSTKSTEVTINQSSDIVLGVSQEVILWVRRISGAGAIKVLHAHLHCEEEW